MCIGSLVIKCAMATVHLGKELTNPITALLSKYSVYELLLVKPCLLGYGCQIKENSLIGEDESVINYS